MDYFHFSIFSQLIPFQSDGEAPDFDARTFAARLIFDLSFFIIVTTIGLNIVFGIIVDTFSELREERVSLFKVFHHSFYDIVHRIILRLSRRASVLYVIFLAMISREELK